MIRKLFYCLFLLLFSGAALRAMVFDNRYFPLIQHPFITVECRPSHFALDFFATTARNAFNRNEEEIGIPELFGPFDERELARSIAACGCPNLLPSMYQLQELPWGMEGKIQSQAFDIGYYQSFADCLAVGFTLFVMRSDSSLDFTCKAANGINKEQKNQLEVIMRDMFQEIGIFTSHARQAGLSDIDAYLRFYHAWDCCLKFRKIEAGFRLGALLPTGVTREINVPASVAYGGNGHWGIYGTLDSEFELKEDWKLGLLARVNKRFAKTSLQRMPTGKEPTIFGVIVGPAQVNPGATLILSSYLSFENLREGFGLRAQYTWTNHFQDCWTDARPNKPCPVNIQALNEASSWRSSYVTLNAFYDFGKVKGCRNFEPILIFAWDVPVTFFGAERVVKTNKIALGVEFNF